MSAVRMVSETLAEYGQDAKALKEQIRSGTMEPDAIELAVNDLTKKIKNFVIDHAQYVQDFNQGKIEIIEKEYSEKLLGANSPRSRQLLAEQQAKISPLENENTDLKEIAKRAEKFIQTFKLDVINQLNKLAAEGNQPAPNAPKLK